MLAPLEVRAKFDDLRWGNLPLLEYDPLWARLRARLYNVLNMTMPLLALVVASPTQASVRRASQLSALYDTEIAYIGGLADYPVLGFVSPRGINDQPVQLPPDAWDGALFTWDDETAKCGSLTVERLRLVDLKALPQNLAEEWARPGNPPTQVLAQVGARSKPGRKSAVGPICQAVDNLFGDGAFRKAPQKVQLEMVLALIRGKDPELDALLAKTSDKTSKGHISRRLAELSRGA